MRIERKPGEILEVDWAGATLGLRSGEFPGARW